MANGNIGWVTKWLVGSLWGVLVAAILFMGNVVKGNDVKREEGDKTVELHSVARHEKQGDQIDKVKEIVTDIRIEQRAMAIDLKHGLHQIEKKL